MKKRRPLTDQSLHLLHVATSQAKRSGQTHASATHILVSLEKLPPSFAYYILEDLGVDVDEMQRQLKMLLDQPEVAGFRSDQVDDSIDARAQLNAERFNCEFVCPEHILLAALQLPDPAVRLTLARMGIRLETAVERTESILLDVAQGRVLPKHERE